METPKLGLIIVLLISLLTGRAVAETQNSEIKDFKFIDKFGFIGTQGRVELKVTNISFFNSNFSNPIPRGTMNNTSLSNMGFFLTDRTAQRSESCLLNDSRIKYKLYTLDNLQPDSDSFDFIFQGVEKPGDYILYFQNCDQLNVNVTMNARSSMYNLDNEEHPNYLSPGKNLVTKVFYPFFALVQFSLACMLAFQIPKLKTPKKTICWLLVFVGFLRAWSLIFAILRNVYIMKIGCADCWLSTLLSIVSGFLEEAPVGIFLILFSTGLVLVKPSLHLGDKILIALEFFGQLVLVSFNVWCQLNVPEIVYLCPRVFMAYCIGTSYVLHQFTVNFSLKFLREVARGNCPNAATIIETPKSIIRFAEILKSLVRAHLGYYSFQLFIILLEIFCSRLWLIITLRELVAISFYVIVACHMRPELWLLKLSRKKGEYDDIEKAEALQPYE